MVEKPGCEPKPLACSGTIKLPEQARHTGLDYADLVEAIIAEALADARAGKDAGTAGAGA